MKPFGQFSKSSKKHTIISENINVAGTLKHNLKENIKFVQETLGESSDIVIREFRAGEGGKIKIGILYTAGLADRTLVQDFILKVLMLYIPQ